MIKKALELSERLQIKIENNMSSDEKNFHNKMQKLLLNPKNKIMLIELLDRSFRCEDKKASFELISHIFDTYGKCDFFTGFEKFLLWCFLTFGKNMPNLSVPFFISHLKKNTQNMVLNPNLLKQHIEKRNKQNITLNVNLIGEEVLGEQEAMLRMQKYKEALKQKHISYISIKITTIFSQINIIDFEYSKNELVKRLDILYALALEEQEKQGVEKFINLDMEEFKDLELTVESFIQSIDKFDIKAGIVLQAYIPDSYEYLKKLFEFSKSRVLQGKKAIKIRFVKGANMENELSIASLKSWELAPFKEKLHTDSNYKKMLEFILENENFKYINIGIASHNIFELAYAYTRIKEAGALSSFSFEMLEGMSEQCSLEFSKLTELILYAPVCEDKHFNNAIAYLVRRLDENTSEDNFMRYFFNLKLNDENYKIQKELFLKSIDGIKKLNNTTHRKQNRNEKPSAPSSYETKLFVNESDTDFILAQNRTWAQKLRAKYENFEPIELFATAGALSFKKENLQCTELRDKIKNKTIAKVYLAGEREIKQALELAKNSKFIEKTHDEIYAIFAKIARLLRERRGDLIAIAALELGKTFVELDAEISEAIDFVEFYPHSLEKLKNKNEKTKFKAKGIGLSIAPWNFPIAISVGSIAAPLAAGNVVIYKPSSLSMLSGYKLCECFWDAGISKDALIYLPAKGKDISKHCLSDKSVKFAVLTGGEDTAYEMLKARADLLLSAETGGKNATIVSKFADKENAIKNIVHSAFSNSGQKCSATSLLILEDEIYNDEDFKKGLVDAVNSLNIGDPFDFKNKLGALASKPDKKILKALNELKPYEQWVLKPKFLGEYLMTPGIKYGTLKGDFTHTTELFCPILSVMRAKNLKEAIEIANSTGYGLTAGLESLDEREWEYFHTKIEAGNIYINKPTTGAIVLRQPFGGIKKSAIGFGRKVGIYNYITQFLDIKQEKFDDNLLENKFSKALQNLISQENFKQKYADDKAVLNELILIAKSYFYHLKNEFESKRDYVNIRGEENIFSYTKVKNIAYRVHKDDSLRDILAIVLAANILNIELLVSFNENEWMQKAQNISNETGLKAEFIKENKTEFCKKLNSYERIRYFAPANKEDEIYQEAARNAKIIARDKPLINGRFELLFYHNEKSLSISYHRYGNLGIRALNKEEKCK